MRTDRSASIGRGKRLGQSFHFGTESAPPGVGIMRVLDREYGVEMDRGRRQAALLDAKTGMKALRSVSCSI